LRLDAPLSNDVLAVTGEFDDGSVDHAEASGFWEHSDRTVQRDDLHGNVVDWGASFGYECACGDIPCDIGHECGRGGCGSDWTHERYPGLHTWGDNTVGALGFAAVAAESTPQLVSETGVTYAQMAIGGSYSLILTDGGTVKSVGSNVYGQLGEGGRS